MPRLSRLARADFANHHETEIRSEPPRTRTWNLEIKSLCRGVSVRFRALRIWPKYAESSDQVFRGVSDCSARLVSN
jgi:hypothetical protein